MNQTPSRVNPPARRCAQREQEDEDARVDPEWSNAEVLEMIYSGCDEPGDHAEPSRFDPADLLDMWRTCYMLCPLHLDPLYPKVPSGVWSRDAGAAWGRLRELTQEHTGKHPTMLADDLGDDEVCGYRFHVTGDELDEVWAQWPHARWYLDDQAEQGMVDIVIEAA